MRCSAWSSLAISACRGEARLAVACLGAALALVVASSAGAHIDATPAFLEADGTETISLVAHNDRALEMDAFAVSVSPGLRIESVGDVDGWSGSIDGSTAKWTGGRLADGDAETFSLDLEAPAEPGPVYLQVAQEYPDDRIASWPITLTVVPGDESSSAAYVWAAILAAALVVAAVVGVAWRRRRSTA